MIHFFKRLYNISILWKFTIIYFALLMVPTIVIWVNYYKWSTESIKSQSDKVMLQTISNVKQNILYTIKNTENIAKEIVFSSDVQVFFNNNFNFSQKEVNYFIYYIQNKLINIKHLYPNKYYKIRFYSDNKSIQEEYDIIYSMDRIRDQEYFQEIQKSSKSLIWGNIKKTEEYYDINKDIKPVANNDLVIPLYEHIRPVVSDKLIGILEIDILVEKMFEGLPGLVIGKKGFIFVTDEANHIISPLSKSKIERSLDLSPLSGISGVIEISSGRERYRLVYDTIQETKYKLVAAIPLSELLGSSTQHKNILIISIILAVIGVFMITYITTHFMFSRLKILLKMMKRIEGGEFDVRIDESREDEIGVLAHGFNCMAEKLEGMISDLIDKETAHRDAEVRALQSQINPHFLYNTLESLRMESELRNQDDLAAALASLGKLFRYNIKWHGGLVSLQNEMDHVRNYITIMNIRFRDKFEYTVDVNENAMACPVIKMMLQPLIENCFHHAFQEKKDTWRITIRGLLTEDHLKIEIIDNGKGIDPERLTLMNQYLMENKDIEVDKKAGSSIGVWNVNKRIKMQFGDMYGVSLYSTPGAGTRVAILMPAKMI